MGLALCVALSALTATARADNEKGKGVLKGQVKWEGERPKQSGINMGKDAYCEKCYKTKPFANPAGYVTKELEIPNVFIYVKSGIKGKYDVPAEPAHIDQHNCMYAPHVMGMMAGQALKITNSDDTAHNIHAKPNKNSEFNFGQPQKGMEAIRKGPETFTQPEIMVSVKCDVHPWMSAFIGVVEHPFFATSGEDGTYEIKDLPDGEYELEAWHEKWGKQTFKITIKGGAAAEHDVKYSEEKQAAAPAQPVRTVAMSDVTGEAPGACCADKKDGQAPACCKAKAQEKSCCAEKAKAVAVAD
jgi:plastocyanin